MQISSITKLVVSFTVLGLTTVSAAEAATMYSIQEIGVANPGDTSNRTYNVNENGQIVGISFSNPALPFGYFGNTNTNQIQSIGTLPGFNFSFANTVNELGQVVGSAGTGTLFQPTGAKAIYWDTATQQIQELLPANAIPNSPFTSATGINNQQQVAGYAIFPDLNGFRAFVYDKPTQTLTNLGTLPGDNYTRGARVNENGQSIGYSATLTNPFSEGTSTKERAFLWNPNTGLQDLGVLAGGNRSRAFGFNELNQVVGLSESTQGNQAFLWSPNTGMVGLSTLPGDLASRATDINSSGLIVGQSCSVALSTDGTVLCPGTADSRAFVSENGGSLIDLQSLIPADSGWDLKAAFGVNDAGQIVGFGLRDLDGDGVLESGTEDRAFLATPVAVPFEPSASLGLLMLGGLSGVGWLKKQLKKQTKNITVV